MFNYIERFWFGFREMFLQIVMDIFPSPEEAGSIAAVILLLTAALVIAIVVIVKIGSFLQ